MAETDKTYRIVELQAENFKRLKAVSIRPDADVVEITGRNGQGKTSILDAILGGLGGGRALPMKPIRAGQESAVIRLDLGDLKVTRRFKASETNAKGWTTDVIVESEMGGRFQKPQDVLDALVGEFTFDPLGFTRLKEDEQFEALKAFVPGFQFEDSAALDRTDFAKRTEVNRDAKALRAQAEAITLPAGKVPAAVDVAALEAKLAEAGTHNASIAQRKARREQVDERISQLNAEIERLQTELAGLEDAKAKAEPLPEPIDTAQVQEALAAGRAANAVREQAARRDALNAQAAEKESEAGKLTKAMDDRETARQAAIKAAKMPVPGLGFDPAGFITLNGQPFSQASDAEQLRASIAIAAAKNPQLRIARVRDGSLLDDVAMVELKRFAAENDLQVWIERVDSSGTVGFVLEDGELKDDGWVERVATPVDDGEEAI